MAIASTERVFKRYDNGHTDARTLVHLIPLDGKISLKGDLGQRFRQVLKAVAPEYYTTPAKHEFNWVYECNDSSSRLTAPVCKGMKLECSVGLYFVDLKSLQVENLIDDETTYGKKKVVPVTALGAKFYDSISGSGGRQWGAEVKSGTVFGLGKVKSLVLKSELCTDGVSFADPVARKIYGHDLWHAYGVLMRALARGEEDLFAPKNNYNPFDILGDNCHWDCELYNPTLERVQQGAELFQALLAHVRVNSDAIAEFVPEIGAVLTLRAIAKSGRLDQKKQAVNQQFHEDIPPFDGSKELSELLM